MLQSDEVRKISLESEKSSGGETGASVLLHCFVGCVDLLNYTPELLSLRLDDPAFRIVAVTRETRKVV